MALLWPAHVKQLVDKFPATLSKTRLPLDSYIKTFKFSFEKMEVPFILLETQDEV